MNDPKWDGRFLDLAKLVSSWSKDPSTKAGAAIVRPDRSVAGVGFNGFARNMSDADELYADREKKYSRVIHCEVNALISVGEPIWGYTLYTYPFMCCDRCVVQMLQAGITRFVYPEASEDTKSRWQDAFDLTTSYMEEAGVEHTEISAWEGANA